MAFFKKLKDRLFKSSSKIDEGLEAIVDDGGVEETVAPPQVAEPTAETVKPKEAAFEPVSDPVADPVPELESEPEADLPLPSARPDAAEPTDVLAVDEVIETPA
ncbi:MAG: signal recognition particle-docking protein FtsY, partial [Roseobacter sp.]